MGYQELSRDELIDELRTAASARAELAGCAASSAAEHERLVHDLRVHQLELEAQNQVLRDAQAQLAESHNRYVDLYDLAPVVYCTFDRNAVVLEINLAGATLIGQTRSRILGKPLLALVHFDQPDALARHIRSSLESETPISIELTFTAEPGQRRIEAQLVSAAVRNLHGPPTSCRTAMLEVTQQRAAEQVARIAAERLASAVDCVHDAFALFDASDHLVLCNSAYRQLLGDSMRGAVAGKSYVQLLDAWMTTLAFTDDRERGLFRTARLTQRHDPQTAFDVEARDGRRLRVMNHRTPEGGLVKTIWDLTEDTQREHQLKLARAAADSANAAKSEFLSSMSHELRTPLNAILGFAQLLDRDGKEVLSTRHKERVGHILRGGEHLLRLISDILDLSSIEVGGVSMVLGPVSTATLLEEVKRTLDPAAAQATIHLEIAPTNDSPIVRADSTRIAQILLNFGSNAIKYNRPQGSVTLLISAPRPGYARLTVADTGIGIPLDKQAKLFQAFQRAGQEAGTIEGTGIGLAISKRLAEAMHGRVGFQSVKGQGSEFWVEVPIQIEQHTSSNPPADNNPSRLTLRPRSVLYIEDNSANVRLMRDLLAAFAGIELVTAATAEIGIELARATPPGVIIMDINLPGMSGLEALHVLRSSVETERIPVIALTASASKQERERGERSGFFRYMTKPIHITDLEATLHSLLGLTSSLELVQAATIE
jgi:PAS domain S-box-containing protein